MNGASVGVGARVAAVAALAPGVAGQGWWRVDKEAIAVRDGYVNERSALWAPDGTLAAYGYQVVTVYG